MLRHQWWSSAMVTRRICFAVCTEDYVGVKQRSPLLWSWLDNVPSSFSLWLCWEETCSLGYVLDDICFSDHYSLWVWPSTLCSTLLSLAAAWRHTCRGHTLFCLMLFDATWVYFFSWVACMGAIFQLSERFQVTCLSPSLPSSLHPFLVIPFPPYSFPALAGIFSSFSVTSPHWQLKEEAASEENAIS